MAARIDEIELLPADVRADIDATLHLVKTMATTSRQLCGDFHRLVECLAEISADWDDDGFTWLVDETGVGLVAQALGTMGAWFSRAAGQSEPMTLEELNARVVAFYGLGRA